ncbi:MAG: 5'-deoxynucleotidase [Ruminococcaceae bacterium]|nr:5'-deoxynucleotidase [Oscillospiraceae bacterium]
MQYHFYAMLSRMKNIYRWGLMRNTKSENLSEHSLEVAVIAHALCVIRNRRFGGNIDANAVATAALFHDTSEIITGDMPTPIKYYNGEIKSAYKQIEAVACEQLLNLLPDDLRADYEPLYNPQPEIKRIIKAADKISALIKCTEEINMGNREFLAAAKSTRKAVEDMNLPEADAFLAEFMESFSLTLDEQKG